ncbi:hypothetical protein IMG5_176100, partial [Ichthyophthirius multifiliis]
IFENWIMLLFLIILTANTIIMRYSLEKQTKFQYFYKKKLREYKNQSSNILALLLPEFVQEEVNQCEGQYLIEKSSESVYILFCDIFQFDQILQYEKESIILLLDKLFRNFDSLCKQYNIQKIETVGKTYMACGGLKDIEKNPQSLPQRIIQLAIDMLLVASQISWSQDSGIMIKIGINVGPVIAGVIGLHKPQFSLIGDTVNTASRICAHCQEGKISISEQVYENVKSICLPEWRFESVQFEAKGKGILQCFYILYKFFLPTTKRSDLTDNYKNLPILIADIAGFTSYSNSVSPSQVVKMVSKLFIKFDQLCKIHNVFKLYTIGDCYMVLGFNDKGKRDEVIEAYNTVEMAFTMIKIIQEVKKEIDFEQLNMRIGLHIGDIIGGVIGTDIVRYDIYGKDVVIANKMESNSEPGKIRVSENFKNILESNFKHIYCFDDEKLVNCVSIDSFVQSWIVSKKDDF